MVFSILCCCQSPLKSFSLFVSQQNKSSESKVKFRQASTRCKRGFELAYATKKKESIISQKPGSWNFWRIANNVLNKGKSVMSHLFNETEALSSAFDKAKLFLKHFSKNSNLDESGISSPVFPFRTNLKLHNISITPKMVKKVIQNLSHQRPLVLIVFQW